MGSTPNFEGEPAGRNKLLWIAMLNGGVKLTTLAGSVHPYPSLAEINKKVVSNFLAGKIFSDTIKKGLKLFFSLKGSGNPCCRSQETEFRIQEKKAP